MSHMQEGQHSLIVAQDVLVVLGILLFLRPISLLLTLILFKYALQLCVIFLFIWFRWTYSL